MIAAIGTPLDSVEALHRTGLEAHLHDQWDAGMDGVLVGGTMGLLQLLTDATYRDLVEASVEVTAGRGQLLVGAGDTSFSRTAARIEFLNGFAIDGVVVLSPYFVKFRQPELVAYFSALANLSKSPLYLYDVPTMTGAPLEVDSIIKLARHANIHGIKCSGNVDKCRELMAKVDSGFEVIVAQADVTDRLLQSGIHQVLDGIYALTPSWATSIVQSSAAEDWDTAAMYQAKLNGLLDLVKRHGIFQTFTHVLNLRGIPGNFAPRPYAELTQTQVSAIDNSPVVQELTGSAKAASTVGV